MRRSALTRARGVVATMLLALPALASAHSTVPNESDVHRAAALEVTASGVSLEPAQRVRGKGLPWDYEIQIALPPSYHQTDKAFPVLWVTDGLVNFESAVQVVSLLAKKSLPQMIVVGVGGPPEAAAEFQMRRVYDFTITATDYEDFNVPGADLMKASLQKEKEAAAGKPAEKRGGAPQFLTFLVDELRPALSRKYRMADNHTLFGNSGGGVFCTYALLSRPQAFGKYVCLSPPLYGLFRMEERYAATHKDLPAKVVFAAGEGEILQGGVISTWGVVSSMTRMAEILQVRQYPSLKLHVHIFPGEEHGSFKPMGLRWGLLALQEDEESTARDR